MSNVLSSTISIAGLDTDSWRVHRLDARERIFEPTRIVVDVATAESIEPDDLIGLDAELGLAVYETTHPFHGVVMEASERAFLSDAYVISIVVASKLALLTLGRDHRIYQEKSVKDVVSDVLSRAGLSALAEWQTTATYEPHENIVQYAESDYDFIARLMHEEGIAYFIEQREDGEHIVFFDDDTAFVAVEGETTLPFVHTTAEERIGIHHWDERLAVGSDKVMLNDYDLKAPSTDLKVTAEAPQSTSREVYMHPGGYIVTGRGQRLADRLLERLRMPTRTLRGASNAIGLVPGRFFTASENERAALDGDYLLLEVAHRMLATDGASSFAYQNEFSVIPVDVPYRPRHAPKQPVIAGVQHAFATVPGGEEIHADDHGRSKVRFVWDRSGITDDKSSTWLRVGQLAIGGSMVMPRLDFEVIVDFELGDLDRPAISGHLYNAEKPPPYALPAGNTVSSMQTATTGGGAGANEMRFEDAAGKEEIYLNASKDLIASIDRDTSWAVGKNQTRVIGGNFTLTATKDYKSQVTKNRTLEVTGNHDCDIGEELGDGTGVDLKLTITGNRFVKSGGDHTENVTGTLTRKVGSLQAITGVAGVTRTIGGQSETTVKMAWTELCRQSRGLNVTGGYTETIGALKFIKAKNVGINCGLAYTMNALAETVKATGGRADTAEGAVLLSAGSTVKMKAKNIVFEAENKIVFRGGAATIELTKEGDITIKAPDVTVLHAKALTQLEHKSN